MEDITTMEQTVAEGSHQSESAEEQATAASFTEGGNEEHTLTEEGKGQSHTQNAEHARRRRAAEENRQRKHQEEMESARQSARMAAILEVLDKTNPYTGKPMTDHRDVEAYLAMKEIESAGGDPVHDYAGFLTDRQRKQDQEKADEDAKKKWYLDDGADFAKVYPEVQISALAEDSEFLDYADGKLGNRPLRQIYEGYLGMVSKRERQARDIAAMTLANKNASPGALSTPGTEQAYLSPEDVKKMSPAEQKRNYDKIRESMNRWNT